MFARLPVSWHAPEEDGAGDDDVDPHAKTVNNVLGRDEVLRVHTEGARVALPVLGTEHLRALGCTLVHPGGEFVLETPCPIYQTIMDMGEDYLEARHDSAEDLYLSIEKAPRCTAMDWSFIPAYCFAIPNDRTT